MKRRDVSGVPQVEAERRRKEEEEEEKMAKIFHEFLIPSPKKKNKEKESRWLVFLQQEVNTHASSCVVFPTVASRLRGGGACRKSQC